MDKQEFFERAGSFNSPAVTLGMYQLYVEAEDRLHITFGGIKFGTMSFRYDISGIDVNLLLITHPGRAYPPFAYLQKAPPFHGESMLLELLGRYNSIPGIHLSNETIHRKWPRPGIRLKDLLFPKAVKQISSILVWQVEQMELAIGNSSLH